jgi:hypothetical protein
MSVALILASKVARRPPMFHGEFEEVEVGELIEGGKIRKHS